MNNSRVSSLDPVHIDNWKWSEFLEYTIEALSNFKLNQIEFDNKFLENRSYIGSKLNPIEVQNNTWACKTEKIKLFRAACLHAQNIASVFNLLAVPDCFFDLPFFGADFVTLPNGYLIALDLQPALKDDSKHTDKVWDKLLKIHEHWQPLLPNGGDIPKEAQKYFSPGFLWTRLPLGDEGEKLISNVIKPAYCEYLSLFLELLLKSEKVNEIRARKIFLGQKSYMEYRKEKDPARGLLNKFFGQDWTDSYIEDVLFDLTLNN